MDRLDRLFVFSFAGLCLWLITIQFAWTMGVSDGRDWVEPARFVPMAELIEDRPDLMPVAVFRGGYGD